MLVENSGPLYLCYRSRVPSRSASVTALLKNVWIQGPADMRLDPGANSGCLTDFARRALTSAMAVQGHKLPYTAFATHVNPRLPS